MRKKNREKQLIEGLFLIAELKDELEEYHYFEKEILMIIAAENKEQISLIIQNENDILSCYVEKIFEMKTENWQLKEELAKLKEERQ